MAISKTIPALLLACTAMLATAQTRPAQHPPSSAATERVDSLKDAEDLLQKQQYQQAEEKLRLIVTRQESNPQAWFDLGFAQSRLGKTTESIAAYKKATELSPKWFEAQQNLGLVLAKSGDFHGAAAALKVAVTLKKPTGADRKTVGEAWISLAQVTAEFDPREAWLDVKKAVELEPLDDEIMMALADRIASHMNDQGEAVYRELADQGRSEAMVKLASLYIQQKRYADAEAWLRKFTAANPGNTAAQIQLAKLLAAQGKVQDAIAALESLNKTAPDAKVARALAGLYLETRQYDPAAKLLQELVAATPADAQLHFDYGSALAHQHKYPEAQAELLKAVQQNPRLVEAYFDLAFAAQQNKNYELAIRVLDTRGKLQQETPATYFLRATAYDSLRMYKPAAENYRLFLAAAAGKFPDQEFQARHRLKAIEPN